MQNHHTQTTIATLDLRQKMGALLEQVHYQNAQFRIARKKQVMARLVNDSYISALEELVNNDSALEDTLWLMLDKKAQNAIGESIAQHKAGETISLEQAFAE